MQTVKREAEEGAEERAEEEGGGGGWRRRAEEEGGGGYKHVRRVRRERHLNILNARSKVNTQFEYRFRIQDLHYLIGNLGILHLLDTPPLDIPPLDNHPLDNHPLLDS